MLNSRFYFILCLISLSFFVIVSCYNNEDSNIIEVFETKKLSKGKLHGTFKFIYEVHFANHFQPSFPMYIQIREEFYFGDILYSKRVEKGESTTISFDLSPGKYCINVSPIEEKHRNEFWDGGGPPFEINEGGILKYSTFDIYLEKKIHVNSPKGTITVPDEQSALKLMWTPLSDAIRYEINWEIISTKEPEIIKEFKKYGVKVNYFKFNFDHNAAYLMEDKYEISWMLSARNKQGVLIGHQQGMFLIKKKMILNNNLLRVS